MSFEQKDEFCPDLESWVHLYERTMLSIAFGIVKDHQLAQDCVQESFIKAAMKFHQLNKRDRIFQWIYSIVINECKTQLRSQWIRKVLRIQFESKNNSYEDKYPSVESSDLYDNVLRLPEKLRLPIILHYYNDISIADLSLLLNVNESTCKVRLRRAKLKLKKMMQEE